MTSRPSILLSDTELYGCVRSSVLCSCGRIEVVSSPVASLIRLRPRSDTTYLSQNYTVLATDRNGFIAGGPDYGLFVYKTRLLSRYRYLIDGELPRFRGHYG